MSYKDYRKNMKEMDRKQLKEQYSKARKRILSFDNSNEMLDALEQFEYSVIYLDKLDCKENNKQNIIKLADLNASFKKAQPYIIMLLQQDLEKNLKIIIEKDKNKGKK